MVISIARLVNHFQVLSVRDQQISTMLLQSYDISGGM